MPNFLSPTGFDLIIEKIPKVCETIQSVNIPGINLGTASADTPFVKVNLPGKIEYSSFTVSFKITEDLDNYKEVIDWINELGKPNEFPQYKRQTHDALITILSNNKKKNISMRFTDIYPINISELSFDTRLTDIQYLTCSVTFAYTNFNILN